MKVEIGTEEGGCANIELKSQLRPSQSRKESILNCLLIGSGNLYTKVKEGSDQEISDLSEEGKIMAVNNCSGSENNGSLFR